MNTMYRIVASRTREIGTLRALGFSRRAILFSFVVESAAARLSWAAPSGASLASTLHGYSTSTANLQSLSEVAFAFRITPAIVAQPGLRAGDGRAGRGLPAPRAARLPIAEALRVLTGGLGEELGHHVARARR